MEIRSTSFAEGGVIPKRYTADGENLSPPLEIKEIPKGTKSLAIIVDDPDAPLGTFNHWIAWGISSSLKEGAAVPHQGVNDFDDHQYRGPAPPPGNTHHYRFTVYALNADLDLPEGASKEMVLSAIDNHLIEKARLTGLYQR